MSGILSGTSVGAADGGDLSVANCSVVVLLSSTVVAAACGASVGVAVGSVLLVLVCACVAQSLSTVVTAGDVGIEGAKTILMVGLGLSLGVIHGASVDTSSLDIGAVCRGAVGSTMGL